MNPSNEDDGSTTVWSMASSDQCGYDMTYTRTGRGCDTRVRILILVPGLDRKWESYVSLDDETLSPEDWSDQFDDVVKEATSDLLSLMLSDLCRAATHAAEKGSSLADLGMN